MVVATNSPLRDKFLAIQAEMNANLIERSEEIKGSLCSIVAGAHMLFLGPPGIAKSMLVRELCGRITMANYFEWLLTKFSTPDEIFGPLSLSALENDEYKRITVSKLPESEIVFLDEIFKANSAILNSLLTALNERLYHNNGHPVQIPLISAFGASNELPESSEELSALYDRFLLRYTVRSIQSESGFIRMLKSSPAASQQPTTLTLDEIRQAQEEAGQVTISDSTFELIASVREKLNQEGIKPSDRRFRQSLGVLKAHAWLRGATEVSSDDLALFSNILWNDPDEERTVKKIIITATNPYIGRMVELLEQAEEIYENIMTAKKNIPDLPDNASDEDRAENMTLQKDLMENGTAARVKLKAVTDTLAKILAEAKAQGKESCLPDLEDARGKVVEFNRTVTRDILGIE